MDKPIQGYRDLRSGRCSIAGQLYLVTTVTWKRHDYFRDFLVAIAASRTVSSSTLFAPSQCLCWVLMPDHWHGLIELGDESLARMMQRFKGVSARHLRSETATKEPIWAKGFHDRALRRDESVSMAARYIIANPVRAGLVGNPMDYPYWGADFLGHELNLESFAPIRCD